MNSGLAQSAGVMDIREMMIDMSTSRPNYLTDDQQMTAEADLLLLILPLLLRSMPSWQAAL